MHVRIVGGQGSGKTTLAGVLIESICRDLADVGLTASVNEAGKAAVRAAAALREIGVQAAPSNGLYSIDVKLPGGAQIGTIEIGDPDGDAGWQKRSWFDVLGIGGEAIIVAVHTPALLSAINGSRPDLHIRYNRPDDVMALMRAASGKVRRELVFLMSPDDRPAVEEMVKAGYEGLLDGSFRVGLSLIETAPGLRFDRFVPTGPPDRTPHVDHLMGLHVPRPSALSSPEWTPPAFPRVRGLMADALTATTADNLMWSHLANRDWRTAIHAFRASPGALPFRRRQKMMQQERAGLAAVHKAGSRLRELGT